MYEPAEDSFLLSEQLEKFLKNKDRKISILDLGAGTGMQSKTCIKSGFANVLCADIDSESVNCLKKQKLKAVKSDLFQNLKNKKFELIIFNPPYLPEDKYDREKDTTGGKKGDETIIRFLTQAKSHLADKGKIILLLSSLTPKERINKIIKENYKKEKLAEKKLFFENLEVWLISASHASMQLRLL